MSNPLWQALFAPLEARATPFLTLPDGGAITGQEFHDLALRQAVVLAAAGVGAGDRVLAQVHKSAPALALWPAAVHLGAVFLPLNPTYTAAEAAHFLADAAPRAIVADPALAGGLGALAPETALFTLDAAGGGSLARAAAGAAGARAPAVRAPGDLAALLYTSGTTGRSKGAMLTHDNLLSNARVLTDLWGFCARDVLVHALPIFHTHGLFVATNIALLSGSAMIWLPGFDAGEVLRAMPRATTMMGVPTFYTRLLDHPGLTREAVAHMRLFVSGSAPLLEATHRAFAARTGHAIVERYGMTETGMNTSNPLDGPRRPGTVGPPLPGVAVRVVEPATGAILPPGGIGQVEVKGPNVFSGYWNLPDKTAEEMRPDGFFVTGDIGVFDAEGYLSIVGRQKDMIISGGLNVYPREVEMALDDLDGVAESAVIGVPHPDLGEAVVAVVVPAAGATPDAEGVRAALGVRLARFKQPRAVLLAGALPRNAMGKVQKAALRHAHGGLFAGPRDA